MLHHVINGNAELNAKVDAAIKDTQELLGMANHVAETASKSVKMLKETLSNQKEDKTNRKINDFEQARFFALSWWMTSMIITAAILFWRSESSTFDVSPFAMSILVVVSFISVFIGSRFVYTIQCAIAIFLLSNFSSTFFIVLRSIEVSVVQLIIFYPSTGMIVGYYLDKIWSVSNYKITYKFLLMLVYIALGAGLGWITTYFPAFEWELEVVDFVGKQITPTLVGVTQRVGTTVAGYVGPVVFSPFQSLFSWI